MKNNKDSLGDRMKKYEEVSRHQLTPRMPVIIRIDGRAFHTFTRKLEKPFDNNFSLCMRKILSTLAQEIQGFKVGYTQSDEISFLLTDYDNLTSEGWFNYNINKMTSISASIASVVFDRHYSHSNVDIFNHRKIECFDSRAFNVPKDDVVNYFLWRAKDWERNSLQMYARSFFSHKELHKKSKADIHEMLYKIRKNWARDITEINKNGIFYIKENNKDPYFLTVSPTFHSINKFLEPLVDCDLVGEQNV